MNILLSNSWNTGTAMGELFSSMFLIFSILTTNLIFRNKDTKYKGILKSLLYSFAGLISIFLGKSIGNLISSSQGINSNYGLGLTTPIFAILSAFENNSFNSLVYIIPFQFIGSLIGFLIYLLFSNSYNKINKQESSNHESLIVKKERSLNYLSIEAILQLFLSIGVASVSSISSEVLGANEFNNVYVLSIFLFVILIFSSKTSFIMISPFIHLFPLIHLTFKKQSTLSIWKNFMYQTTIHVSSFLIIGSIVKLIRYS